MALINCPECNKEVSDIAKSCPHCGFPLEIIENDNESEEINNGAYYQRPSGNLPKKEPNKKKNGFVWIVVAIICLFIGCGSCSGDSDSANERNSPDSYATYDEYVESKRIVAKETTEEIIIEESTIEEEIPNISMEDYMAECQEYNYKDVLRNPKEYVGQKVKIKVEVSTVHEASWLYNKKYYFAYSEGDYGYFTGDRYAIIDKRYDSSLKILSEDVVMVYGEIAEPEETESLIVNSEELFTIDMRYVELISE